MASLAKKTKARRNNRDAKKLKRRRKKVAARQAKEKQTGIEL